MKNRYALSAFLLAFPALAQESYEAALTYDRVQSRSQTLSPVTFAPAAQSALGVALAWYPWQAGTGQVGLSLSHRLKGKADLRISDSVSSSADGQATVKYTAVGVRWQWRQPIDLGVGLQARFESLGYEAKDGQGSPWTATWTRPWLEAMAGYTFQGGAVKPFVALSVALPLVSESAPTSPAASDAQAEANQKQMVKATGPKFELALRVGLRF